ncbi:uncharacterized protein LOC135206843 [Macrobrachium nipponense]|uniref:uncharacterized protein LOC135206843 n=1 Tax=Macrobrachium nipponense TaxID=159736 RepID=UPI0030C8B3AD
MKDQEVVGNSVKLSNYMWDPDDVLRVVYFKNPQGQVMRPVVKLYPLELCRHGGSTTRREGARWGRQQGGQQGRGGSRGVGAGGSRGGEQGRQQGRQQGVSSRGVGSRGGGSKGRS